MSIVICCMYIMDKIYGCWLLLLMLKLSIIIRKSTGGTSYLRDRYAHNKLFLCASKDILGYFGLASNADYILIIIII